MVAHAYDPSTGEVDAGWSEVQGHFQIYKKIEGTPKKQWNKSEGVVEWGKRGVWGFSLWYRSTTWEEPVEEGDQKDQGSIVFFKDSLPVT